MCLSVFLTVCVPVVCLFVCLSVSALLSVILIPCDDYHRFAEEI